MKNFKNVIFNFLSDSIILLLNLFTSIITARLLGPEYKGVLSYILSLIYIFVPIFLIGTSSSYRYFLSSKKIVFSKSYISVILRCICLCIIMILAISLFKEFGFFGNMISYFDNKLTVLTIVLSILVLMNNLHNSIFIGLSKFSFYNSLRVLRISIYLISLLIVVINFQFNIYYVLCSLSLSFAVDLILSFVILSKYEQIKLKLNSIKKINSYSVKVWLTSIVVISNKRIDQLIIGLLIDASFLGLYSVSVMISELVNRVTDAISPVYFNINSSLTNQKNAKFIFLRFCRINFLFAVLGVMLIILLGKSLIILLYGNDFSYSYNIILFYLPGVLFWVTTRPFYIYFSSSGLPEINSKIELIGLIMGFTLYFLLIPLYGIIGAATASSITFLINLLVAKYFFEKNLYKINFFDLLRFKKDDFLFIANKLTMLIKK